MHVVDARTPLAGARAGRATRCSTTSMPGASRVQALNKLDLLPRAAPPPGADRRAVAGVGAYGRGSPAPAADRGRADARARARSAARSLGTRRRHRLAPRGRADRRGVLPRRYGHGHGAGAAEGRGAARKALASVVKPRAGPSERPNTLSCPHRGDSDLSDPARATTDMPRRSRSSSGPGSWTALDGAIARICTRRRARRLPGPGRGQAAAAVRVHQLGVHERGAALARRRRHLARRRGGARLLPAVHDDAGDDGGPSHHDRQAVDVLPAGLGGAGARPARLAERVHPVVEHTVYLAAALLTTTAGIQYVHRGLVWAQVRGDA